ncbi:hypothetical protein BAE44_0020246 [Dichanthelium oligosanthes]|uniref:Inner centromere protein ARK-binding domain-containing protein n=1 Tax=Dichanthelium oligosanthes TaxID=888268 RepID=A0A1E5V0Q4_9POAL|nr:hypothetical protein BAE44_0020246 [Dichanthelium oligosanthes]
MCALSEDPSPANSVEVPHSALNSLLQNDTWHSVDADFEEAPHPITITSPQQETTHTAETGPVEDPRSIASPLLKIDSLHSVKPNFLEGLDSVAATNPENESLEVSRSMVSALVEKGTLHPDEANILEGNNSMVEKDTLHSAETVYIEVPHDTESSMASLLLENGSTSAKSLEGPHGMASPPVEKDVPRSAKTDFLQGTYSMPSLLLDKEAGHTSETTSLEGPSCLVSPKIEKDPFTTIDCTGKLRKRSSLLVRCDNEISRILEHQSSGCHVLPAPINESALQPYRLADNTSEAYDICAWNNIDISARPEALSAASCKSARALHTAERSSAMSTGLQHHGTEQKICFFNNAMEINVDSCTTVSDNQTKSPRPSAQHLFSSGSSKKFSSLRLEMSDIQGTNAMASLLLEKEPTLTDSLGEPHFLASPLLEKATLHCVQTDFLEAPYSMSGTLFDMDAGRTSEMSSVERLFLVSPQLENDLLHTVEQLRKRTSLLDRSLKGSPKIIEQKNSGCDMPRAPFNESSVQPDQLPDTAYEVPEMLGMPQENMFEDNCGTPRCSLARSAVDLDKLQPKHMDDGDAFPNSIVSSGTIITHNDSSMSSATKAFVPSEISHNDSSTGSATDAFISAESELSQMQPSLANTSLECVMAGKAVEAHMAAAALFASAESVQRESVLDLVKCQPKQSDHAHAKFSDKDKSVTPNISCGASSKRAGVLHTAESNITTNESLQTVSDRQNNSPEPSYEHLCSSVFGEKFSSLGSHVQRTASHLDKWSASGIRENSSIECPNGGVKIARAEYHSKFDETMQECQSFSIPVPSNSPAINYRAYQGFYESTKLINLSSSLSAKYKMKQLDGVYQSLPSKFEKLMNRSLAYSIDTNLLDPSYDIKKSGVFGKYSLDFDGAFMMSDDLTYDSSNGYGVQEDSDVPLTLSAEKYNLEKLSGRTGSSSDYLGSIPEFACFRIDENSSILGGNENQVKLSSSIGRNYSRQGLAAKPLGYATNIHQSKGTSRLDLIAGKSYIRKLDRHVHIRVNQDIQNPKENRAPSIRKEGKVTHPLLERLSKTEMSSSKSERNKSKINLEKGCRPRNIVSNMTSFIPLVKQKQRPPTSCVKRDVRVRALGAAEAAKRCEEKKQTERENRKAAVELECERLKQEQEHRQKQVEQQKKKDAGIITRKRQRENDRKKGNDRKKKCVEEAPKDQKQLYGKDLVENLVRAVKIQLLSDERMESVHRLIASESNSLRAMPADWKSEGSGLQVTPISYFITDGTELQAAALWAALIFFHFPDLCHGYGSKSMLLNVPSVNLSQSYEMTPYEDSDEEDFVNLEHKMEIRRRSKLIPSWTQ